MLSNYFQNIDWLQLFTRVPPNDVEGIWQIFKSIVTQAIVLHVFRRVIHAKAANRYPPYIQRAIRLKRTLWRKRYYAGGRVRYTIRARKCKKLIKRYYANKERHLLSGKSFTTFYKHVNAKLYSSHGVAPLHVNGQVLTKDEDKVQAFNTDFCSVFTAPSSVVISLPTNNTQYTSTNVNFAPNVVYEAMHKVNNLLASGSDGIPSYFWKKLASVLSLPVSVLFTASYHFSVSQSDWACAFVKSLFKKNDPSNVSKYRPISLTSALCKVMETIAKDNLIKFAVSHKILNEN